MLNKRLKDFVEEGDKLDITPEEIQLTIAPGTQDEEVFTKPWTIKMNLYRRTGQDAQIIQFKCVEFVEELMYGKYRAE